MISVTARKFRECYAKLPENTKISARKSYKKWKTDPFHTSLQFKQIHNVLPIYSVRIGLSWRALGVKENKTMISFWIESHAEYDKLIKTL
jgi:hypothetical protein